MLNGITSEQTFETSVGTAPTNSISDNSENVKSSVVKSEELIVKKKKRLVLTSRFLLAEREGFEPSVGISHTRVPVVRHKPG